MHLSIDRSVTAAPRAAGLLAMKRDEASVRSGVSRRKRRLPVIISGYVTFCTVIRTLYGGGERGLGRADNVLINCANETSNANPYRGNIYLNFRREAPRKSPGHWRAPNLEESWKLRANEEILASMKREHFAYRVRIFAINRVYVYISTASNEDFYSR